MHRQRGAWRARTGSDRVSCAGRARRCRSSDIRCACRTRRSATSALFVHDEWNVTSNVRADRRASARRLPRDDGSDARLQRRRRSSSAPRRRSIRHAARRRRANASAGRRSPAKPASCSRGAAAQPLRALRAQLPASESRGVAVLGAGDRRQHRAEHHGRAGDRATTSTSACAAHRARFSGSLAYFYNRYAGFISTEIVADDAGGLDLPGDQPRRRAHPGRRGAGRRAVRWRRPDLVPRAVSVAWTHGTVLSGHAAR